MTRRWAQVRPGERILVTWRRHPLALARTAAPMLGVGIAAALLATTAGPGLRLGAALAAGVALVGGAWQLAEWWIDEVVVTDRNVLRISGILVRRTTVLPVEHVTRLDFRRSIAGRLLGYGECALETAGHAHEPLRLDLMPDPDRCYRILQGTLAELGSPEPRRLPRAS